MELLRPPNAPPPPIFGKLVLNLQNSSGSFEPDIFDKLSELAQKYEELTKELAHAQKQLRIYQEMHEKGNRDAQQNSSPVWGWLGEAVSDFFEQARMPKLRNILASHRLRNEKYLN